MLICPELETVFILVPRTGSGTLYREIMRVYPRSMLLYRHMEADGVPQGYDRWRRVGFVRHPTMRLFSLYKFMQTFGGGAQVQGGTASLDARRIHRQVEGKTFFQWLETNSETWVTSHSLNGDSAHWPVLTKRDHTPENIRSQFSYLRPDLGTEVLKYQDLPLHMKSWGLNPVIRKNKTNHEKHPDLVSTHNHISKHCAWDLAQRCEIV